MYKIVTPSMPLLFMLHGQFRVWYGKGPRVSFTYRETKCPIISLVAHIVLYYEGFKLWQPRYHMHIIVENNNKVLCATHEKIKKFICHVLL